MPKEGSLPDEAWKACAEHPARADVWFPERGELSVPAKAICRSCLVQPECLAFALDEGFRLAGIWGGTSQNQRKVLLRSGKVTGELVRRWGAHAMHGRELERDWESGIAR